MEGWVSIHRKIFDNEFYFLERFTKMQAWIDLLLLANHKRAVVFVRGLEVRLKPGELFHSQDTLAKRWGWNKRTVKKFLSFLQNRQMIHYRIENKIGVITIVNWKKYQVKDKKVRHKTHYRVHSNNNVNNNKPGKNEKSLLTFAQKHFASLNNKQLLKTESKVEVVECS